MALTSGKPKIRNRPNSADLLRFAYISYFV
jgi:hypothetical protein